MIKCKMCGAMSIRFRLPSSSLVGCSLRRRRYAPRNDGQLGSFIKGRPTSPTSAIQSLSIGFTGGSAAFPMSLNTSSGTSNSAWIRMYL